MPEDERSIHIVINGETHDVEADPGTSIRSVVRAALLGSNNWARPPSDWELRYESCELIADWNAEATGLPGRHLYLTLNVGAGGAGSKHPWGCPCNGCDWYRAEFGS